MTLLYAVEELDIHFAALFCKPFSDGGVGSNTVFVSVCLERCLDYGVGITVLRDHGVLVDSA